MKFLDPFWKASFYKNNSHCSFWGAFARLVLVNLVIGILSAIIFHATFGKDIPQSLITFGQKAVEGYPSDLVVTIKDGVLTKNIPGELKLYPFSLFFNSTSTNNESSVEYFISIDESKTVSLATFASSSAVIFLGKEGWVAQGSNDIRINSYESLKSMKNPITFSKNDILYAVNTINTYADKVPLVCDLFIILFFTIVVPLIQLFFVLIIALILMLLSKWVITHKVTYGEAYVLALYALAPVVIMDTAISYVPYLSGIASSIPLFQVILVCVFLWYMHRKDVLQSKKM